MNGKACSNEFCRQAAVGSGTVENQVECGKIESVAAGNPGIGGVFRQMSALGEQRAGAEGIVDTGKKLLVHHIVCVKYQKSVIVNCAV